MWKDSWKNLAKKVGLLATFSCCLLQSSFLWGNEKEFLEDYRTTLRTTWSSWYPYSYLKIKSLPSSLTGLDIRLVEALSKILHIKIIYRPLSWDKTLNALQEGNIDFVTGASFSEERAVYAYYSDPYRFEENSLFVLRKNASHFRFKSVDELIQYLKNNKFRLGIKEGVIFASPELNHFIANKENAENFIFVKDEKDSLDKLLEDEIDGFLADRIVGSSLIWHLKKNKLVSEHYFGLKTKIHLIFSKKTTTPETVAKFNKAIQMMHEDGTFEDIIAWYLYPVILLETVETPWFRAIDLLGTIFFSISGILIANSLNASFLAAFVYALLPSVGGGLFRDVLFGQRPEVLSSPMHMIVVLLTVIIGYSLVKWFNKFEKIGITGERPELYQKIYGHLQFILTVCDALGLAAFTVTGVLISLMAKVHPLWLWGPFFAFLTGAAGTIIRDILSKRSKLEDIEGEAYSEIALIWGLFLSLGLIYNIDDIQKDVIQDLILVTIAGTFLSRLAIYFFKVPNVYFK